MSKRSDRRANKEGPQMTGTNDNAPVNTRDAGREGAGQRHLRVVEEGVQIHAEEVGTGHRSCCLRVLFLC